MNQRDVNAINQRIEILYRSETLKQTAAAIAQAMGLSASWVGKVLPKARCDRRAIDGAVRMAASRKEKLDAEFS